MKNIGIIYTGGTMGMEMKDRQLKPMNTEKFRNMIPDLGSNIYKFFPFPIPIDSSNINHEDWLYLVKLVEENYHWADSFIIIHGTDTMAYTASVLSFLIVNLSKPIIITGSQLPMGVGRTDARENLLSSIEIAQYDFPKDQQLAEVCIYFNGKLFRGNRTKKTETNQFDAFDSENYPILAEVGVNVQFEWANFLKRSNLKTFFYHSLDKHIAILKIFPGISEAFMQQFAEMKDIKAVVLESFGSGNVPNQAWFMNEIKRMIEKGIMIVNVSQCPGGKIQMGHYETSTALKAIGVVSGSDITTEAALAKLMVGLANVKADELLSYLCHSQAGEMDE